MRQSDRKLVLLMAAVLMTVTGCGTHNESAHGHTVVASLTDVGFGLVQPGSVYVLARMSTGGLGVVGVDKEKGSGKPVALTEVEHWGRGSTPVFTADAEDLWIAGEGAVYQVDPVTGKNGKVIRPRPVDGLPDKALTGTWISALAIQAQTLYLTRNTAPVVQMLDIVSGSQHEITIPDKYAGAQTMSVDSNGWIYLGVANQTAIVNPRGQLMAELPVTAMRAYATPDGLVALPGVNGTCGAYLRGKVVRSYPMGMRLLTACEIVGDAAVGWDVQGGGFTYSKNSSTTDVDPNIAPTSVVSPLGETLPSAMSDAPVSVCLAADGTVWTLGRGGFEVGYETFG